jgi:hypothetical protein
VVIASKLAATVAAAGGMVKVVVAEVAAANVPVEIVVQLTNW